MALATHCGIPMPVGRSLFLKQQQRYWWGLVHDSNKTCKRHSPKNSQNILRQHQMPDKLLNIFSCFWSNFAMSQKVEAVIFEIQWNLVIKALAIVMYYNANGHLI